MNNEACRKAFEAHEGDRFSLARKGYGYRNGVKQYRWEGFQAAYNLRLSVEEIKAIAQVHMVDNWANVPDSSDIELLSQAIFDAQEAKS